MAVMRGDEGEVGGDASGLSGTDAAIRTESEAEQGRVPLASGGKSGPSEHLPSWLLQLPPPVEAQRRWFVL